MAGTNRAVVAVFARALTTFSQSMQLSADASATLSGAAPLCVAECMSGSKVRSGTPSAAENIAFFSRANLLSLLEGVCRSRTWSWPRCFAGPTPSAGWTGPPYLQYGGPVGCGLSRSGAAKRRDEDELAACGIAAMQSDGSMRDEAEVFGGVPGPACRLVGTQ